MPTLGAKLAASFPTLFSTASGVLGLVAGPSSALQRGISSEAFQLAWAGVCGTGLRTRSRHVYVYLSASPPLSSGSAATFDSALARCHGSRLLTLGLLFVHRPAKAFLPSPTFRKGSLVLPRPCVLPATHAHFVPPFGVFPLADPESLPGRQSRALVLMHSSNHYPLGNCNSPWLETSPGYFTRFGAASHRSSSRSSLFACTDDARTSPEELVNPASVPGFLSPALEGLSQPA
jgi:hypothetical protein